MKRIILFRHGKSLWETGVSDFERDLSFIGVERTEKAAKELNRRLNFTVDACFSSPAQRARKTAEIACPLIGAIPNPEFDEKLYTFSFFDLLRFIKNLDNQLENVLFLGHNEAYTEFVSRMSDQYLNNLPTSGVAIIEFDIKEWEQIEKGRLITLIKPKKL